MKLFRVPPDPFAKTPGSVAMLKNVVADRECEWHKRSAAIVSVVQIAQMDRCQKGTGREDLLQWVLDILSAGADEDIYFALQYLLDRHCEPPGWSRLHHARI